MSRIYFVAPYASEKAGGKISCTPSSITYCNYIISAFSKSSDRSVNLLSLSPTIDRAYLYRRTIVNNDITETYFGSLPTKWGIVAIRFNQIWIFFQLFVFLLFRCRKNDVIVIFHDYGLSHFLKCFRKCLRGKFVYLICEVFSAVYDRGERAIGDECDRLKDADAYILINNILPDLLSIKKDFCVCSGNYSYVNRPKIKDDKIHILYAGKISTGIINDAFVALDVIDSLPEEYVLHIAGYGETNDVNILKDRIGIINREFGVDRVFYEGNLSGENYEYLLSRCVVGLCTRSLRNELSNYCFPSKTLVYLTHDILPICPQIDTLKKSVISSQLAFVEGDLTPVNIANAIIRSKGKLHDYNNKEVLKNIDNDFCNELNKIIK